MKKGLSVILVICLMFIVGCMEEQSQTGKVQAKSTKAEAAEVVESTKSQPDVVGYLYIFSATNHLIIYSPVVEYSDGYLFGSGTIGNPVFHDPSVIQWKDPAQHSHIHYLSAGQIVHLTSVPMPADFSTMRQPILDFSK